MRRYDAVILDVDGTLVASNDAHARAWAQVLRRNGFEVAYESVRALIGKGGSLLVHDLTGLPPDAAENQALQDEAGAVFEERYLREVGVLPHARALVDRLRAEDYGVVVASSSSRAKLRGLLGRADLEELLEFATSADDATDPKPEPDIICAAVDKAGVSPERAVLIGDTPYDVEAARAAGVAVIGVRSGGWLDEDLEGCIALYDGIGDLLAGWSSSPLARAPRAG